MSARPAGRWADVELEVDRTPVTAVVRACATLVEGLERASRHGYLRVSAETDHVTGLQIARAIGELGAVTVRPGIPAVVTVGLNARSVDVVVELLYDLILREQVVDRPT